MAKKEEITEAIEENKEEAYLAQLQRLQAEFINFQTRVQKEKIELQERTKNAILVQFLSVKENFDRAPKLDEGMELVYKQFQEIFTAAGVEEIPCETFNPTVHEALATNTEAKKDVIVDVVEKGYIRNNIVLRPARVVVGTGEKQNE